MACLTQFQDSRTGPVVRSRRGGAVGFEADGFEHPFHAIDVIAVAHHDHGVQAHAAQDLAGHGERFDGGRALALDDGGVGRDAVRGQVRSSDAALGEDGVAAGAAGSHDSRGESGGVELEGVIEAGLEDR